MCMSIWHQNWHYLLSYYMFPVLSKTLHIQRPHIVNEWETVTCQNNGGKIPLSKKKKIIIIIIKKLYLYSEICHIQWNQTHNDSQWNSTQVKEKHKLPLKSLWRIGFFPFFSFLFQKCIQLKVTVKTLLQKISNKCCSFEHSNYQQSWSKCSTVSHKY